MSDNHTKASCEREISAYLDLPAEVFTDIFKLLTRRELVQHVEPVNKTFKAICDRNVKSIHVIEKAEEFFRKLAKNDPEANQQVEALSGHNCALAGQFVIGMKDIKIYTNNGESQAIQSVLRHSMDLFQRCQIRTESKQLVSEDQLAYLTLLEPAKPVFVNIGIDKSSTEASLSTLLRHPTILNCLRLKLIEGDLESVWDHGQPIIDWLHHNPMNNNNNMLNADSSSCIDVVDQQQQPEIRCILLPRLYFKHEPVLRMLDRCVQHLQRSRGPTDRRHFLLAFRCANDLDVDELNCLACTKNLSTGEVLLLERVLAQPQGFGTGYRLVRCLANQIANGREELYAKLFNSPREFKLDELGGKKPFKVIIEEKLADGPDAASCAIV